ncbi:MAG: BrnA antitoxin family protein [Betaproteobacteria bacterium]|nr:BrnA antitoxin family protein [Betaproteobacteria bacterium]
MKRTSTSKTSARSDDAPRITQANFDRAEYRVAGKKVSKAAWQEAARAQLGKKRISIMLDAAIIEHFKSAAGERGYQTLINDTLRRAVAGESLAAELRNVMREELAPYRRS